MSLIKTNYLTLTPAYGRDYRSKNEAEKAFEVGQDFEMESLRSCGGRYCSIRDFEPGVIVNLRYDRKTKVTTYTTKAIRQAENLI